MPEHLVCLTFDHDNASANIARGLVTPTMISRGDFGIPATERILKLLDKYSIPTTWFVPGHTIESYPSCVRSVANAGHEIANHGWTHRVPASLGREGKKRNWSGAMQPSKHSRGAPRADTGHLHGTSARIRLIYCSSTVSNMTAP